MLQIELQNPANADVPALKWFETCAALAYQGREEAEVTLRIVGDEEGLQLNRDYRGRDYPTNILSFPNDSSDLPEEITQEAGNYLGDLAFCADVLAKELVDQHKETEHHWAHLVIHGMLHLQGYDHEQDDDAVVMEALEIQLLGDLGIPDPYQ